MKNIGFLLTVLSLVFGYAHASECALELEKIDAELVTTNPLPPETLLEAQKLRDQGASLCNSGSTAEGLAKLDEAKSLLGVN